MGALVGITALIVDTVIAEGEKRAEKRQSDGDAQEANMDTDTEDLDQDAQTKIKTKTATLLKEFKDHRARLELALHKMERLAEDPEARAEKKKAKHLGRSW